MWYIYKMEVKELFSETFAKYTTDPTVIEGFWVGLEVAYSGKDRFYHNLDHLHTLVNVLAMARKRFSNWDAVVFAIFYHDFVYKATNTDNEEQSAKVARKTLSTLGVPENTIGRCEQIILATKTHDTIDNWDVNSFLDADLSVLGMSWEIYSTYAANVRKEYSIYPDFMYNPGRKKVLKHFLEMPRIFKTSFFYRFYETQARVNILKEIELLSQ